MEPSNNDAAGTCEPLPSFASDLLPHFETALKYTGAQRKCADDFIMLMRERAACETRYAADLTKLCGKFESRFSGSLRLAIDGLIMDYKSRIAQTTALADNLITDIVQPMQELMRATVEPHRKAAASGQGLVRQWTAAQTKHEKAKVSFQSSCKEVESLGRLLTSQFEQPAGQRTKLMNRFVVCKQQMEVHQRAYQSAVDLVNTTYEACVSGLSSSLKKLESMELERQTEIQSSLRKYVVYQTSSLRNLQYDVEQSAEVMEGVDIPHDLQQFVRSVTQSDSGATEGQPLQLQTVEFEPSGSDIIQNLASHRRRMSGEHQTSSFMLTMKGIATQLIPQLGEEESNTELAEMWSGSMTEILDLAWSGNLPEVEHYSRFNVMIKEKAGRKLWTQYLTQKRVEQAFRLAPSAFELVGNLMMGVINECEQTNDMLTAKQTLTLAQVFYQTQGKNEPTEYLSGRISSHSLWQRTETWERIVDLSINEELENYVKLGIDVDGRENVERKKNVVFCQLGNVVYILPEFGVDLGVAVEIVSKYAYKYDLSEDDVRTLIANVSKSVCQRADAVAIPTSPVRGVPDWIPEASPPPNETETDPETS